MDVARGDENRDEQPGPDLLSDVARLVESARFGSGHVRKVRRLLSGMVDGCIVIVVDGGAIPANGIYQVKQFQIGPAEKQE